jgi:hypothetical protein
MRQSAEEKRALMEAEMQTYGATNPRELMLKKATATREQAEQQARMKRLQDAGDILDDWEDMDPKMRAEYQKNEDFRSAVSHLVDPDSLSLEKEGMRFRATTVIPSKIQEYDGSILDGETAVGQEYIKVEAPEGPYFKKVVGTEKLAGKGEGKSAAEEGLPWDKAAAIGLGKMIGTTTASGIVIDPTRQAEYQLALRFLNKHRRKDVNTAVADAHQEAKSIVNNIPEGKDLAQVGKNKKTGKYIIRLTDGTTMETNVKF